MALTYVGLHPDTKIQYKNNDDVIDKVSLSDLVAIYKAIDKPIIILSFAVTNALAYIAQQSYCINVNARDLVKDQYAITLSNGAVIKCSSSTLFGVKLAAKTTKITISSINGLPYLAAQNLSIGDRITAINQNGYLEVVGISVDSTSFVQYYGLTAPVYGNFLIEAEGETTESIVVGN